MAATSLAGPGSGGRVPAASRRRSRGRAAPARLLLARLALAGAAAAVTPPPSAPDMPIQDVTVGAKGFGITA
ncbi:MAG: hypothetical protein P8Y05_13285, partial [Deinococcales bacterium]